MQKWVKVLAASLFLLPTIHLVLYNSYFYLNVNQINNGSAITGYISWEGFYAQELMEQLDRAIGREKNPLEYKHSFRKVIEEELAKAPETRAYFDEWGSRCYLSFIWTI